MNISKIAKLAGVSPATVSRYLNNGYVSDEKRQKIAEVIECIGYVPLTTAQATISKKFSHTIGIIVPKINSEATANTVAGINDVISEAGYRIILANTDNTPEKEIEYLRLFTDDSVDGIILLGTVITNTHRDLIHTCGKPVVIVGQQEDSISSVYYDDFGAAFSITNELIDKGCTSIAFIGVMRTDKAAGLNRLQGFTEACERRSLKINKQLVTQTSFSAEGGYEAAKQLVEAPTKFDGLICATDSIAFGAMKLIMQRGLKIPDDVKVCGIGDSKLSQMFCPSLSSAHLYHKTGGKQAAQIILDAINGDTEIKQQKLGYDLFIRESSTPSVLEMTV